MALVERIKKPIVVILDKASIQAAKKTETVLGVAERKRHAIYLLPVYIPELNRIEVL
jgi:transposase